MQVRWLCTSIRSMPLPPQRSQRCGAANRPPGLLTAAITDRGLALITGLGSVMAVGPGVASVEASWTTWSGFDAWSWGHDTTRDSRSG